MEPRPAMILLVLDVLDLPHHNMLVSSYHLTERRLNFYQTTETVRILVTVLSLVVWTRATGVTTTATEGMFQIVLMNQPTITTVQPYPLTIMAVKVTESTRGTCIQMEGFRDV